MAQKSLDIDYITLRKIRAVNHKNNTNPDANYILATNGRGDCDWTNTIENIATYGAYLGSSFMVVGGYGENALAYDRDGIHWYGSSNGANLFYNGQALCGAWNGVLWVAGGESFDPSGGPMLVYSSDGITWTDNSGADLLFGVGGQCNAVAWDGEKWLAGGRSGLLGNAMALLQSSDGLTWTPIDTTPFFYYTEICSALAWNGSVWLMGTNYQGDIWSSLDGITWTHTGIGQHLFNTVCTSIAWNGRLWIATGDVRTTYSPIYTSPDGTTWTPSPSSLTVFPYRCNSVAWNGSLWVAAGHSDKSEGSSTLAYSRDGQTWTASVNGLTLFPAVCNSVIWNGSLWVAGGSSQPLQPGEVIPILPALGTRSTTAQPLAYSSDGMTWFPSIPETSQLFQVNFVASNQILPYIGINKTGPVLHQEPGPGGRVVYDTSGQNLFISRILTVQEPGTEDGSGTVIVTGNVLPETTNTYSLGSSTHRWKDLHLDGASIYIGNTGIINANNNGAIGINYPDPSSNELIGLEVGKASYFHESVGINTAPFTSFTVSGEPIPALLIEGIVQLGVTQPQFMSVYNNNNQVNGYIYGDVSDGSISIGYNYQNAKPALSAQGTTVTTLGTSQIKMLEDTIITYIDASQNNVNSPGTVGWAIIGNGLGNPASIGIGTEDPSPLYALDVSGTSHVSSYMVVDGSFNSFSISTGAISSTTVYASTSALIDGSMISVNISTGAIRSSTVYASTSALIDGSMTSVNVSTGSISSSTVYASTSVGIGIANPGSSYALDVSGNTNNSGILSLSTTTQLYGDGSGNTFITSTLSTINTFFNLADINVAVGDRINYESSSVWTDSSNGSTVFPSGQTCIAFGKDGSGHDLWVAGSSSGIINLAYSTDAIVWTPISNVGLSVLSIAYNSTSNTWFAVGNSSNYQLVTSTDGIHWSPNYSLPGRNYFPVDCIAWNGSYWLIGGLQISPTTGRPLHSLVQKSVDGTAWAPYSTPIPYAIQTLSWAANKNLWVAGGSTFNFIGTPTDPRIATSSDGETWTPVTGIFNSSPAEYCSSIAYHQGTWVAAGANSDTGIAVQQLAISTDPTASVWTVTSSGAQLFQSCYAVMWDRFQWVAGGYGSSVIASSSDGTTWTPNAINMTYCTGLAYGTQLQTITQTIPANILTINPLYVDSTDPNSTTLLLQSNKTLTFGSETGALYVTNGLNTGQLYDTYFNPVTSNISTFQSPVNIISNTQGDPIRLALSPDPSNGSIFTLEIDGSQNSTATIIGGSNSKGSIILGGYNQTAYDIFSDPSGTLTIGDTLDNTFMTIDSSSTTINNNLYASSINPGTFFTDSTTISGEFGVQSYSQFTGTLLFTLYGAGGGGGTPFISPPSGAGGGGAGGTLQGNFNFTTPTDISFNFTVGSGGIGGYIFGPPYYQQDGTPATPSSFSITINGVSYNVSENPAQPGFVNETTGNGVGGSGGYFTIPSGLVPYITEVSGGTGVNVEGLNGGQGGASSTVFYGNGGTGGSIQNNIGTGVLTPTPGSNGQGAYCAYSVNGTSNNNTFNYIFANTSTAIQNATVTTASIQNATVTTASIQNVTINTASISNLIGQSTVTYQMGTVPSNSYPPYVLQNPPFGNGLYSVLISTTDTQSQPNYSIRCCIGLIAYWTNTTWTYGGNVSYTPNSGFSNNSVILSISQDNYIGTLVYIQNTGQTANSMQYTYIKLTGDLGI